VGRHGDGDGYGLRCFPSGVLSSPKTARGSQDHRLFPPIDFFIHRLYDQRKRCIPNILNSIRTAHRSSSTYPRIQRFWTNRTCICVPIFRPDPTSERLPMAHVLIYSPADRAPYSPRSVSHLFPHCRIFTLPIPSQSTTIILSAIASIGFIVSCASSKALCSCIHDTRHDHQLSLLRLNFHPRSFSFSPLTVLQYLYTTRPWTLLFIRSRPCPTRLDPTGLRRMDFCDSD